MKNIIFAGTPEFASIILTDLLAANYKVAAVLTQPDRPAGRGRHLQMSAVKQIAVQAGLPVLQPVSLRDPTHQLLLQQWQPDLLIVVAYGLILPTTVLTIPRLGCINVHASLLPRWRGAAPIQHAIIAGDEATGITIMQMEAGLDTGPMLKKLSCNILATDTGQTLHDKLAALGSQALLQTLPEIFEGIATPEKQNDQDATYATKINKADAKINWQEDALTINRKIRAFNSWPIAFTQLHNAIIRIWQAEIINEICALSPGTIIAATTEGIDVATSKNIIRIKQLQLPGAKMLPVATFLNARAELFKAGTQFH